MARTAPETPLFELKRILDPTLELELRLEPATEAGLVVAMERERECGALDVGEGAEGTYGLVFAAALSKEG